MHQQFLKAGFSCLLASSALLGCSAPEPVAQVTLGVIGGTETGNDYSGVVYVTAEIAVVGGAAIAKAGSGAVLAPNLIATALHVISHNPSDMPFTCDATGNDVSGSQGSQLGAAVAPEKVAIYAGPLPDGEPLAYGLKVVTSGSTTICQNDIAFVVLDHALDLPAVAVHRGAPADVGDVLTAVGFAGEDTSQLQPRTQREVTVTAVGQWIRTFTVSEGPCEGDSGGPALSDAGELVGVFSTVAVDCTNPNAAAKYTDVSFFSTLVQDAFEAAGAGTPWAVGGAGAAGAPATEPAAAGAESAAGSGNAAGAGSPASPPSNDSGCALRAGQGAAGRAPWLVLLVSALLLVGRNALRSRR
jgi:Trypsin